jgi:hypothetical protein
VSSQQYMISFRNLREDRAAVMGYMDQRDCPAEGKHT